jgi:hypothetical protein
VTSAVPHRLIEPNALEEDDDEEDQSSNPMRCGHEKGPATSRPSAYLLAVKITLQDLDAGDRHHGEAAWWYAVASFALACAIFPPRCASLVASACAVAATNAMSLSRTFWTGSAVAPSKVKPLTPIVTEVAVLVRLLALPGNIGSA